MGLIKTKGLVIKEQAYREQDKILTIFSEEDGKIQCMARGVRRYKSSLLASTQVFAWAEFIYYPGKTFGNINQANLIESFYALRNDLNKLALGSYLLDLMNNAFDQFQKSPEILKLVRYVLYYISTNKAKSDLLMVAVFQMKLVSYLGYCPGLMTCMNCGSGEKLKAFNIEHSGVVCSNCHQISGYAYKMTPTMLKQLRDFLNYPIIHFKNQEADPLEMRRLNDLLDHYIAYSIGKSSRAYSFYKTMYAEL